MKKTLVLFSLFTLQCGLAWAQTDPAGVITPPAGPLVKNRAPDFASWTTALLPVGDSSDQRKPVPPSGAGEPIQGALKRTVVKTGKIYHSTIQDAQGHAWSVWSDGNLVVTDSSKGGEPEIVAPPGDRDSINPLYLNFARADFEGLDWISARNYRGSRKVQGRDCFVFSERIKVRSESTQADKGSAPAVKDTFDEMEACVDSETRLPVSLKNANGLTVYTFLVPPETMQTFPSSIVSMLDKRKQLDRSLVRRPGRPY